MSTRRVQLFFLFAFLLTLSAHAGLEAFKCAQDRNVAQGANLNWKTSGGLTRSFYAQLPKVAPDTPVGVIFSWHGVGDNVENWHDAFDLATHSSSDFPFIVITPDDTGLSPFSSPQGIGWDLFVARDGYDNREFALFESVLACLGHTHKIASDRIYSAGFSAGAFVSNMLHARYPKLVSAVFAGSGAWINDDNQRNLISIPPVGIDVPMDWPRLDTKDHGTALISFGGPEDSYGMLFYTILNFHDAGVVAPDFLHKNNRTAVVCEHQGGHSFHPSVTAGDVVNFFKAHTANTPSPYRQKSDLPGNLASACWVVPRG